MPVGSEGDAELGDLIEDKNSASPTDMALHVDVKEHVASVLKTLTPRDEAIIRMCFGLNADGERTLEEIARTFALTRERIRQIEIRVLRKLRHPLGRFRAFAQASS